MFDLEDDWFDHEAVEALPQIRHAFELGRIDEMLRGPWGDVLNDLGVEPEEGDPLLAESQQHFEERHEKMMPREQREQLLAARDHYAERNRSGTPVAQPASVMQPAPRDPRRAAQEKARKQKNKRKMGAAARKANRRKRR